MNKNPFKITFTLQQLTPIIHFQHEQEGATLRGTELKPKLDKFLLKHLKAQAEKHQKTDKDKWLIRDEKGEKSINYKVSIQAPTGKVLDIRKDVDTSGSLYFGNMGVKDRSQQRKAVMTNGDIRVTFFSFYPALVELIETHFPSFLTLHNFGTRQNKGFGGFFVKSLEGSMQRYDFMTELKKVAPAFIYAEYSQTFRYQDKFSDINVVYKLMKSGWNFDVYFRSYLFQYFLEKGIGNDKRFIKENFFRPHVRVDRDGKPKEFVRALLGVQDGIEFKDRDRRGTIAISSKQVDRFKSPLTFKIIRDKLIILPGDVSLILGKTFQFEEKVHNRSHVKNIETPKSFDIHEFLFAFGDYFNELYDHDDSQDLLNRRRLKRAVKSFVDAINLLFIKHDTRNNG